MYILAVFVLKVLVPDLLLIKVLALGLSVSLSAQKYTCNLFKSWKQEALNRKSEQGPINAYLACIKVYIYIKVCKQADIPMPINVYMQANKIIIDLDVERFAADVNAAEEFAI